MRNTKYFFEILILLEYLENSNAIQGAGQVDQNDDNLWPAKSTYRQPAQKSKQSRVTDLSLKKTLDLREMISCTLCQRRQKSFY